MVGLDEHWKEARKDELAAMKRLKVYEFMRTPPGRHKIETRWVFRIIEKERDETKN